MVKKFIKKRNGDRDLKFGMRIPLLFELRKISLTKVNHLLQNPVYNALLTGEKHLIFGTEQVKFHLLVGVLTHQNTHSVIINTIIVSVGEDINR